MSEIKVGVRYRGVVKKRYQDVLEHFPTDTFWEMLSDRRPVFKRFYEIHGNIFGKDSKAWEEKWEDCCDPETCLLMFETCFDVKASASFRYEVESFLFKTSTCERREIGKDESTYFNRHVQPESLFLHRKGRLCTRILEPERPSFPTPYYHLKRFQSFGNVAYPYLIGNSDLWKKDLTEASHITGFELSRQKVYDFTHLGLEGIDPLGRMSLGEAREIIYDRPWLAPTIATWAVWLWKDENLANYCKEHI